MGLSFLPQDVAEAISHLNYNKLTEIRLRRGQPVIVEYDGIYSYLDRTGISGKSCIKAGDVAAILNSAMDGCVYNYAEQMKKGFVTVEHGVRIGIAGEYVTQNGSVISISNITSLNIRIPHEIKGCADTICKSLYANGAKSTLIFAKPGLGKTTTLRDISRFLSKRLNVLVFDERGEIAAIDGFGNGFDLGEMADVVRCYNKLDAISSAIRAMKPDVIITDELYGESDVKAVSYAADCGITVIASSHCIDRKKLGEMPFDYYVYLSELGAEPQIYDKNFNSYSYSGIDNVGGSIAFGK